MTHSKEANVCTGHIWKAFALTCCIMIINFNDMGLLSLEYFQRHIFFFFMASIWNKPRLQKKILSHALRSQELQLLGFNEAPPSARGRGLWK